MFQDNILKQIPPKNLTMHLFVMLPFSLLKLKLLEKP